MPQTVVVVVVVVAAVVVVVVYIGGAHQGLGGAKPPKFFPICVNVYWKQVIKKYKNDSRKHA